MTAHARASMLVIGDEILDGHTRDTNSGWLAARLASLGVPLDRIVTVPDEVGAIGEALGTELRRSRPRMVVTSGGIGSTPDDLTMEAVAAYLGRTVVRHSALDAAIASWAAQSRAEGIPIASDQAAALRKMTLVPEGSYMLEGSGSDLPGVAVDLDGGVATASRGATIVVLPGVPSEFRRLFDAGATVLLEGLGRPEHVAERRHPYPESALSPLLEELVVDFPDVHVGSYPARECLVRLKGPREQVERAMARVEAKLDALAAADGAAAMSARWQARWE